jgi:hypothetical protein
MAAPRSPDPHEDEIEFALESLDDRPPTLPRPSIAVAWHRLPRPRRPAWLTRRRLGLTALALALVAASLLGATGLAGQWWRQGRLALLWAFAPTLARTTIVPAAPGTLPPPGDWQRIPLPPATGQVDSLVFSPTDPQAALACAGPTIDPTAPRPTDGPIGLWRTSDGGQRWQPLPIPARVGTFCGVQVATGAPQRLLLTTVSSGECQSTHPLLSTDAGQHWRSLSPSLPPLPDKMAWCSLTASISPRHVFAVVEYSVLVSAIPTLTTNGASISANYQTSVWNSRSDDDGQTWTAPAAATLLPNGTLAANALGGEGLPLTAIAGYASPGLAPSSGTRFWTSSDLGASWQPQATLPGFAAQRLMAPPGVTLANASARKPLYALSGAEIPWEAFRLQVAQITGPTWALVPPLPVSGATAEHTGVTVVLTATPSGKLLVLGLGPRTTFPSAASGDDPLQLTQWLWEWDPVVARWNAITALPPHAWPSPCATPCWRGAVSVGAAPQGSGAYLWLTDGGALARAPLLLRLRLPAQE